MGKKNLRLPTCSSDYLTGKFKKAIDLKKKIPRQPSLIPGKPEVPELPTANFLMCSSSATVHA